MRWLLSLVILGLIGCGSAPKVEQTEDVEFTPRPRPVVTLESAGVRPTDHMTGSAHIPRVTPTPRVFAIANPHAMRAITANKPTPTGREVTTDDVISQLKFATTKLHIPYTANIRDKIDVRFSIAVENGESPAAQPNRILVSKIMTVKMTAPDFSIVELSPSQQALATTDTEWRWQITPTKPGKRTVYISANALVRVDAQQAERNIKTYDTEILIDVTTRQRLDDWIVQHWQWAWTALLLPILALVRKWLPKKK